MKTTTHTPAQPATPAIISPYLEETSPKQLKWTRGNAKLRENTIHMSIPAGWTCLPWAEECMTTANPLTGKIKDGDNQKFRCYAATMEAIYKNLRTILWNNYHIIKNQIHELNKLTNTLTASLLPHIEDYYEEHEQLPKVRLFGTSGDFFHENLYKAALNLANRIQPTRLYWYTKAVPLWIKYKDNVPDNLVQNASKGGRFDHLIDKHDLKYAQVVYSFEEAKELGLPIDKRDELASEPGGPFAIPIHGTQPKGSDASKALSKLRKKGFHGYSKRKAS